MSYRERIGFVSDLYYRRLLRSRLFEFICTVVEKIFESKTQFKIASISSHNLAITSQSSHNSDRIVSVGSHRIEIIFK